MQTKKLRFSIDLATFHGSYGVIGKGTINIEIHGTDRFLGLTVWHERVKERHQGEWPIVLSRTALRGTDAEPISFKNAWYEVHTTYANDPLLAAEKALRRHLEVFLPNDLRTGTGVGIKDQLEKLDDYRQEYAEQVIEPVSTAVLGMCRNPRLHEELNNGDTLWAIGLWRLEAVMDFARRG